jgi:hypothetical protein
MSIESDNTDFVTLAQTRLRDLRLYGGPIDGRGGAATQAALLRALAPMQPNGRGTGAGAASQVLDNTDCVMLAQVALQALGLYAGPINGHGDAALQVVLQRALSSAFARAGTASPPPVVPPPSGEFFVAVMVGQSGRKYTMTGEAASTTFNSVSQYRPALAAGDWGRVIEPQTDSAVIPTIANGGLLDRPITTQHFQNVSNQYLINRGVVALAQMIRHMTGKTPIIVVLAVGGTSLGDLMNDAETTRYYEPFKATLDYVRATYGEIDLYSHFWHGSETPAANYFQKRSPQFFRTDSAGAAFTLGTTEPIEPVRVDHSIFDANVAVGEIGQGTIPRRSGTLVSITCLNSSGHNLAARNSARDLLQSPMMAGMGMAEPTWAPHGGHTSPDSKFGQAWTGMMTELEAMMIKAGIGNRRPAISNIYASVGGQYAYIEVPVPVGHKLTTWRRRYNAAGGDLTVPARVSPQPSEMDWFGFFIARNGVPITSRVPLTRSGTGSIETQVKSWTLVDDGFASGLAVLRLEMEQPFENGTRLTYRQTDTGGDYSYSLADSANTPWGDLLVVENPALWNSAAVAPIVGPQVVALESEYTLSITAPPAAVGDPQLLATYTPTVTASVFESGTFTVPSGNGVLLVLTEYNSSITTDEVVTHSTIGANGRSQGTGTGLTLLNALSTKSQNAAVLAYGIQNPGAGTYTWQFNVGATSIRHMRAQFVWVPNAVLPVAAQAGQGVGGTSTTLVFTNAPTATTALSLYVGGSYNSANAWSRTVGDAAVLDEGAGGGGGGAAASQIRGAVYWDKHNSLAAQSVTLTLASSVRRVGLYLELVGT